MENRRSIYQSRDEVLYELDLQKNNLLRANTTLSADKKLEWELELDDVIFRGDEKTKADIKMKAKELLERGGNKNG